jgi:hypothetical protein
MISGAKEMITGGAKKAFAAAKEASGIRQVRRGEAALDSAKSIAKEVTDARKVVADRVKELVKGGADKDKALRYAIDEVNLPQTTLEGRQAIDKMGPKALKDPSINALRKKFNASLDFIAPAVRAADPAVSKAAIGKEFLQVLPEGFTRRLLATAGAGGSYFNPALLAPTAAFSPFTTGVATSLAGVAGKGIEGLTRSQMRRALVSALASRSNTEEGK